MTASDGASWAAYALVITLLDVLEEKEVLMQGDKDSVYRSAIYILTAMKDNFDPGEDPESHWALHSGIKYLNRSRPKV